VARIRASSKSIVSEVWVENKQRSAFVPAVFFPTFGTSRSGLEERRVWKGQSFTTQVG
jgi:hypothetical protein